MKRLEDQIARYSSKSRAAQRTYKRLKVVEIVAEVQRGDCVADQHLCLEGKGH